MGSKKESIEARVLAVFESMTGAEWRTSYQIGCHNWLIGSSYVEGDKIKAACGRLRNKSKLEERVNTAGVREYRLHGPLTRDDVLADQVVMENDVMSYFAEHASDVFTPEWLVDHVSWRPGTLWTLEMTRLLCERLVDQGRLRSVCGSGYFLPKERLGEYAVCETNICGLLTECVAALYPNGEETDLTADTLATRIQQLRIDHEKATQLWTEELEKRHAAEQKLVDEQAKWQKEQSGVVFDHAVAEKELEGLQSKVDALGACYRGLFGKKGD